jgi:hypothetical protein
VAGGLEAMSTSDCVYPFPGRSETLFLNIESAEIAVVTRVALDALEALRPAWAPLSVEAVLFALDGDDPLTASLVDVEHPHRQLIQTPAPAGVVINSMMTDPVVTEAPELTGPVIERWLENALHDVAPPGGHGEWEVLYLRAGRAWVGPAGWRGKEHQLRLHHDAGTVVAPIERTSSGAWLSGPREPASDQPPLDIRLTNRAGLVTLRLTRNYAHWIDANQPARQRLQEVMGRLLATGWEMVK